MFSIQKRGGFNFPFMNNQRKISLDFLKIKKIIISI